MHEASIAASLVETVRRLISPGERVARLSLRIGALAGVDAQALRFAFPAACAGTPVAGAGLDIEEVGLAAYCPACDEVRELPSLQRLRCPICKTPTPRLLRGRELEILSFEAVSDPTDPAACEPAVGSALVAAGSR